MSSWDKKLNSEPDDETLVNVGPNSTNAGVVCSPFCPTKNVLKMSLQIFLLFVLVFVGGIAIGRQTKEP